MIYNAYKLVESTKVNNLEGGYFISGLGAVEQKPLSISGLIVDTPDLLDNKTGPEA